MNRALLDGYRPIADYAVIGDTRTAALIALDGTVEWLCLPRFDSPSVFAAILDRERGGRWTLRPTGGGRATRRYIDGTNVLETEWQAATGRARVVDSFSLFAAGDPGNRLHPEHEITRSVTGLEGTVQFETTCQPRPDYGQRAAALRDRRRLGIALQVRDQQLSLLAEVPLQVSDDGSQAGAIFEVAEGETRTLTLVSDRVAPAVLPPPADAPRRVGATVGWWTQWTRDVRYDGPHRDAVVRSALALKLLVFSPSGAIVAAPTTSLPEKLGGSANWDYRYCWLRDAAFTVRALFELGHGDEASAFLDWLLHATRITLPELQVVYDVFGEAGLDEREIHLNGYGGSAPVRIGNRAATQHQLDVYGEVVDAAMRFREAGGSLDGEQRAMLGKLGETVCRRWQEPDHGIWESRGSPRQYTSSKMLAWVALERLLELDDEGDCGIDRRRIIENRDALRADIEERGFDEGLGTYVGVLDTEEMDASVLSGFLHGYADWHSERVASTIDRTAERLGRGPLVYRHTIDGDLPAEGAFGATSFWLAECLARVGRVDEARAHFDELLGYGTDVGLFAEEIDPDTGAALGNFPQALTHVALVNAALTIEEVAR